MAVATPEDLQNVFSDVNELARNSFHHLSFEPEY